MRNAELESQNVVDSQMISQLTERLTMLEKLSSDHQLIVEERDRLKDKVRKIEAENSEN